MHSAWVRVLSGLVVVAAAGSAGAATTASDEWVPHAFDFGVPSLNFKAAVPPGAKVETVPMSAAEPGTLGRVKIVGKIPPVEGGPQVEATIVGYDLRNPASALRICRYESEAAGYIERISQATPDQTEAQLYGNQADDGKPRSALFSYCFARGNQALAVHFGVDVRQTTTLKAAKARVDEADEYAQHFMAALRFEDDKQANFGDATQRVQIALDGTTLRPEVPGGWEIPINDFKGKLPAELHLLRRSQGKDVGLIWLWVQPMKARPDLDTAGAQAVRQYFMLQTPDTRPPELRASEDEADLAQQGVKARVLHFDVTRKSGEDAGEIEATVTWQNGNLVVLSLWSTWRAPVENKASAEGRNLFFSRLPGLTTYDVLREAVMVGRRWPSSGG